MATTTTKKWTTLTEFFRIACNVHRDDITGAEKEGGCKRKGGGSDDPSVKRSAFGDITNIVQKQSERQNSKKKSRIPRKITGKKSISVQSEQASNVKNNKNMKSTREAKSSEKKKIQTDDRKASQDVPSLETSHRNITTATTTTRKWTTLPEFFKMNNIHHDAVSLAHLGGFKRQGDNPVDPSQKRRAAFGDITNALNEKTREQKKDLKKSKLPLKAIVENAVKPPPTKTAKEAKSKIRQEKKRQKQLKENDVLELDENVIQLSQESRSLTSSQESTSSSDSLCSSLSSSKISLSDIVEDLNTTFTKEEENTQSLPEGVDDVDKENLTDIAQVAVYAPFIFDYYKERELKFMVPLYMDKQTSLTTNMRAILVDWLVEVQENFELNHETLYLAVKLVDLYLSHKDVSKERLQLVGAAALFIACKFDERCPPMVADFLYICDDAYTKGDFLAMERSVLKTIGFDIGMPLSYRFLRRYAKCARASMETLTLARYVLELSLMEYDFLKYKESELASACLLLAFNMKKCGEWNKTLEFYTGYCTSQLLALMKELNQMVECPSRQLTTIRSKYSHRVFYEVAKLPALKTEDLTS